MVDLSLAQTPHQAEGRTGRLILRWMLYILLLLFALFYLLPLFVM